MTDYFNVVVWRQLAELCSRYLAKGRNVCVTGELQNRSYDGKDGVKRYVTEVIAGEVEFLTPKGDGAAAPEAAPLPKVEDMEDYEGDDELPF